MFEINEVLTIPLVSNGSQPQFRLFLLKNIQCGVVIVCTSHSDFEIRPPKARKSTGPGFFFKWQLLKTERVKIQVDFQNNFSYNCFGLKYEVLCKLKKIGLTASVLVSGPHYENNKHADRDRHFIMTLFGLGDLQMDIAFETLTERLYTIFISFP